MSINPIKSSLGYCVKNDVHTYKTEHIQSLILLCRGIIPKYTVENVAETIQNGIISSTKFKPLLKYYLVTEQLATQPDIGYNFSTSMISKNRHTFNVDFLDGHQIASLNKEAKFNIAYELIRGFAKVVESELSAISSNVLLRNQNSGNNLCGFGSTANKSPSNYAVSSPTTGKTNHNEKILSENGAFSSVTEIAEISFSFETKINTISRLISNIAGTATCLKAVPFEHKKNYIDLLSELISRIASIWARVIAALMHTSAAALKIQKRAYLYHSVELNDKNNYRYHNSLSKMIAAVAKIGESIKDYFSEISSATLQYSSNINIIGRDDDVIETLANIASDILIVPAPILSTAPTSNNLFKSLATEQQINTTNINTTNASINNDINQNIKNKDAFTLFNQMSPSNIQKATTTITVTPENIKQNDKAKTPINDFINSFFEPPQTQKTPNTTEFNDFGFF